MNGVNVRPVSVSMHGLSAAMEQGRTCALAADCQRDLQKCVQDYPDLFPPSPFDPRLLSGVSLANAFGSPWATAEQLRIANRSSLWVFAADWLVDYVAESMMEVQHIVRGCLAVADRPAAAPDSPLARFLAEIRDELAAVPAFAESQSIWRDQLERYLSAMAREWRWKMATDEGDGVARPTLDEYVDNSDNFGSSFVNVSHWILTGDPETLRHLEELREASGAVQRVLRLLNDLASHGRDIAWGDLNALLLGASRAEVNERIAATVGHFRDLIDPLRGDCPQVAVYLERQIGYSMGFYGATDYWGQG
jgi:terpene synthase-like protein